MKTLIYIGNKSGVSKNANLSSIDVLGELFVESGFNVHSASNKKNIVIRLLDMLWVCFKYRKQTDYVLIDTYSTLNFYYAYFVSQLCRFLKLKYIPILHGGDLPNRLEDSTKLSNAIFNNAYLNVAPSEYIKSKFEGFGFNNIVYIPNSIKIENYVFKKRSFDSVRLLWVRSFSKIYNPILAVKLLKALKTENIDVKLCMVGPDNDGSFKEVKAYADNLKLDIHFTGKLPKQKWLELSENYNIFINTTNVDNMPVSVIEAMALGLPVISTNVGGLPFLITDNETGLLVAPDSVDEFLKSIKQLMDNAVKTDQIIDDARRFAEGLDWKVVKKHWIKVLK